MKNFVLYICMSFCLMVLCDISKGHAQEAQFFETLYDIPIMSGLEEVADMALSFDQPEGRISQASAIIVNDMSKEEVLGFYMLSLGQMGWKNISEGVFVREGEKLEIHAEKSEDSMIIKFLLQPY